MKHIQFSQNLNQIDTAILIKTDYLNQPKLEQHYLANQNKERFIAFDLPYPNGKVTIKQAKDHLVKLLPHLVSLGITTLYVADATYFKALTKSSKAEVHIGYVLDCTIPNFTHLKVIMGINYGQLVYNPNLTSKLDLSLKTLCNHLQGTSNDLGHNIIKSETYPTTANTVQSSLYQLNNHPMLTCDVETTGLALKQAELYTIAFAWDKHSGITFKVTKETKPLLKRFFEAYQGTLVYHNATFDIRSIIHNIFMETPTDYQGMLHGLHTLCRKIHDTKIIAYLATNNTQTNELGLKTLSQEYVGNYAIDVKDVTKHPIEDVLKYNLIDCLATWFVYEKYYPIMLKDNQQNIYQTIMLPSIKTIVHMELVGMPVSLDRVNQVSKELDNLTKQYSDEIYNNPIIEQVTLNLQKMQLDKINAKLKAKRHTLDKVKDYQFNPNSNNHLQYLLYHYLGLPVLNTTDTGNPATGSDDIAKLINHTEDKDIKSLLQSIINLSGVNKITSTFIPALKDCYQKDNGEWLHGSFNLGGTLSGRMSSSNPNLQQIPSNSQYGKLIKSCFVSREDWIMVGADFSSLEDRINALLTKDENKLKVYTDGFDGHSLRAFYYWRDKMPDIVETVESINSIQSKYKELRQKSKAPTFALTYGGTYHTLMNNCGFTEQEAKQIEDNYHNMYQQSDQWVADKIKLCENQGYIDSAFGLRIRTPILGRTILNTTKTPYQAKAEARSVGNAISGQSYGLLTNRAINALMEKIYNSPYKYDIHPISLIHDAIYLIISNDLDVLEWVNTHLIQEMQWQGLDEIKHDQVRLTAELDVYYPNWSNPITLPNNLTKEEIEQHIVSSIK